MKRAIILGAVLSLASCGGADSPIVATASVASSLPVTWTTPTANVDGTTLTDLAGYRVYYGTSPGSQPNMVSVGKSNALTIQGLLRGVTYYVSVSAVNSGGTESAKTGPVATVAP